MDFPFMENQEHFKKPINHEVKFVTRRANNRGSLEITKN
jgi:hypothetical protein